MLQLGLCCLFLQEPIRFRTTTVAALRRLSLVARRDKLARLCLANAMALEQAITYCADHGIGAFRINSGILPVKTHPFTRYEVADLPDGAAIVRQFRLCGRRARENSVRLSFHPDQFVLLSSPRPDVVARSIEELTYQTEVAGWVGADVINLHGGGGYGDKPEALRRLSKHLHALPAAVRRLLTLENDERVFAPADLLPFCKAEGVPFVYDVHHHRCHPDGLTVGQVTERALATWSRKPLFHVSSPRQGWTGPRRNEHHDYIDPADFPREWKGLNIIVDVEAKAKELAVARLLGPMRPGRFQSMTTHVRFG
jgi:UV DNA damage endonuclease